MLLTEHLEANEDVDHLDHTGQDDDNGRQRARLRSIAERDRRSSLGPLGDPDLPTKVVDRIDDMVDVVRNRVTRPIERAATAVALGLVALIAGSAAVVLVLIGIFRLASELFSPYEWIAHATFGVLLLAIGILVFWRKAFRPH